MFTTIEVIFSKTCCFLIFMTCIFETFCQVYFVDYGNSSIATRKDIYELISEDEQKELENEPDAAIECVLSEVQPSPVHDPRGRWTEEANKIFFEYCKDNVLRAKVSYI